MTQPIDPQAAVLLAQTQIAAVTQADTHTDAVAQYWKADGYLQALIDAGLLDAARLPELKELLVRTYAEWIPPPHNPVY
ncbi:TPA: hypothetical protein RQ791_004613 [Pseudomonas aeruginosa]|nr:hypothetical protein [Pseudomonas aeruginosa]